MSEEMLFSDIGIEQVFSYDFEKPAIMHEDGSVSCMVEFTGANCSGFSKYDFYNIYNNLTPFLNSLETKGTTITFSAKKVNEVQKEIPAQAPFHIKDRIEVYNQKVKREEILTFKFYITVHIKPIKYRQDGIFKQMKTGIKSMLNLTNLKEKIDTFEGKTSDVVTRLNLLSRTMSSITSFLAQSQFNWRAITEVDEYINIIQEYTRPKKSKFEKIDINQSTEHIKEYLFSGVRAEEKVDYFILDNYFHRVYTLDKVPRKEINEVELHRMIKAPYELDFHIQFRKMDYDSAKRKFSNKVMEKLIKAKNQVGYIEDPLDAIEHKDAVDNYFHFARSADYAVEIAVAMVVKIPMKLVKQKLKRDKLSIDDFVYEMDDKLNSETFFKFGGSSWVAEPYAQWRQFTSLIPGNSGIFNSPLRTNIILPYELPYVLPLFSDRDYDIEFNGVNNFFLTSNADGLFGKKGEIVPFDLMSSQFRAWNYLISGSTGSGKSVTVHSLISFLVSTSFKTGKMPSICILDVGGEVGSYELIADIYNATVMNFNKSSKPHISLFEINLNESFPNKKKMDLLFTKYAKNLNEQQFRTIINDIYSDFHDLTLDIRDNMNVKRDIILKNGELTVDNIEEFINDLKLEPGFVRPGADDYDLILSILDIMLSKEVDGGLRLYDIDLIRDIINGLFETCNDGEFPTIDGLIKYVEKLRDHFGSNHLSGITKSLEKWTSSGEYPYFATRTNIDTNNDFILADLKGLDKNPQLQSIYTLLVNKIFTNKMYKDVGKVRAIIRDEAWSIMSSPMMRKAYIQDMRTARKYGFATLSITQQPTDWFNPSIEDGKAIINNSQVSVFCGVEPKMVEETAAMYDLNEDLAMELPNLGVQSTQDERGVFRDSHSRILIQARTKRGVRAFICDNILSPKEIACYSSSVKDRETVKYYRVHRGIKDLEKIVEIIASGQAKKDEGLKKHLISMGINI